MKDDLAELVEYLDQKFEKTATKEHLDRVEAKVVDLDVRMTQVEERLGGLEESVHALTNSINLQKLLMICVLNIRQLP